MFVAAAVTTVTGVESGPLVEPATGRSWDEEARLTDMHCVTKPEDQKKGASARPHIWRLREAHRCS